MEWYWLCCTPCSKTWDHKYLKGFWDGYNNAMCEKKQVDVPDKLGGGRDETM